MNKTWLSAGGVLALVLVVTVHFGPDGSIFSPGPVAANHQKDREGSEITCASCHGGDGVHSKTQCLSCHAEKERTPKNLYKESFCVECHQEHAGADAKLTAVPDEACWGCHKEDETHITAPVSMAFGLEKDPRDCASCHKKQHHIRHRQADVAQMSMADLRADPVATHSPTAKNSMFHKKTCTWCHAEQTTFTPASASTRKGFNDPHVTHVGQLKIGCTWCHTSVDVSTAGFGPSIRRNANTNACIQCHGSDYYGLDPTVGREIVKQRLEKSRGIE